MWLCDENSAQVPDHSLHEIPVAELRKIGSLNLCHKICKFLEIVRASDSNAMLFFAVQNARLIEAEFDLIHEKPCQSVVYAGGTFELTVDTVFYRKGAEMIPPRILIYPLMSGAYRKAPKPPFSLGGGLS